MPTIRPLSRADLAAVVALRAPVWPENHFSSDEDQIEYLEQLFLDNPWRDDDIVSLVAEDDDGSVIGFHGVMPRPMRIGHRRLRMAVGSQFVIDPSHRGLLGLQMLRRFLEGPQDLSMTDRGTAELARLWRTMGGREVEMARLMWTRPLLPLRFEASRAARGAGSQVVVRGVAPAVRVLDWYLTRPGSPFAVRDSPGDEKRVDLATFAEVVASLDPPDWITIADGAAELEWVASFWDDRGQFGDWESVVVEDPPGTAVGAFLWMRDGLAGDLLRLAAGVGRRQAVMDRFLRRAKRAGMRACRGRCDVPLADLLRPRAYTLEQTRHYVLVHSNDRQVAHLLGSGHLQLDRLVGEWITRF